METFHGRMSGEKMAGGNVLGRIRGDECGENCPDTIVFTHSGVNANFIEEKSVTKPCCID